MFRRVLPSTIVLIAAALPVAARQDPEPVRQAVEHFLAAQTQGLAGEVSYSVGSLDTNNRLAPCTAFDVSLPPGARAFGRTSVQVRCVGERGWSVFLPVHIRVVADYLVTARPLAQGQTITADTISRRRGDLGDLPPGTLTDEAQALGRSVRLPVAAGLPLRTDLLRPPLVVQQNQTVKIVSTGQGFQVTNEGKALNDAADGQPVHVRLGSGQVVSGTARSGGVVEVSF